MRFPGGSAGLISLPPMISLREFDYDLPDDRIALKPAAERDGSRLLLCRKGKISHHGFRDLPGLLPKEALLVFNDTRVIPARLEFRSENGARIELFLLQPADGDYAHSLGQGSPARWSCMIGNRKRWKQGVSLKLDSENIRLMATASDSGEEVSLQWSPANLPLSIVLEQVGKMPMPPYIKRETEESDKIRYQTIFAQNEGAVAAPTASLHFTNHVLETLEKSGIGSVRVTLHVGAGTFLPVKTDDILQHRMHAEQFRVSIDVIEKLIAHSGPVIPVGTTSLRTLESLYWIGQLAHDKQIDLSEPVEIGQDYPYQRLEYPDFRLALDALRHEMTRHGIKNISGATSLFIRPGYRFGISAGLITNFHQPRSTLLMLIASLIGKRWKEVYQEALNNDYRFLSYGDSSLLLP